MITADIKATQQAQASVARSQRGGSKSGDPRRQMGQEDTGETQRRWQGHVAAHPEGKRATEQGRTGTGHGTRRH